MRDKILCNTLLWCTDHACLTKAGDPLGCESRVSAAASYHSISVGNSVDKRCARYVWRRFVWSTRWPGMRRNRSSFANAQPADDTIAAARQHHLSRLLAPRYDSWHCGLSRGSSGKNLPVFARVSTLLAHFPNAYFDDAENLVFLAAAISFTARLYFANNRLTWFYNDMKFFLCRITSVVICYANLRIPTVGRSCGSSSQTSVFSSTKTFRLVEIRYFQYSVSCCQCQSTSKIVKPCMLFHYVVLRFSYVIIYCIEQNLNEYVNLIRRF